MNWDLCISHGLERPNFHNVAWVMKFDLGHLLYVLIKKKG